MSILHLFHYYALTQNQESLRKNIKLTFLARLPGLADSNWANISIWYWSQQIQQYCQFVFQNIPLIRNYIWNQDAVSLSISTCESRIFRGFNWMVNGVTCVMGGCLFQIGKGERGMIHYGKRASKALKTKWPSFVMVNEKLAHHISIANISTPVFDNNYNNHDTPILIHSF